MAKQVSNRLLINSVLLIIVAVLVYFIGYQPNFRQSEGATSKALFSIAAYQAEHIHISRRGKEDIVIKKIQEEWRLLKPAIAPLNPNRIKHLLTILVEPIIASYDPTDKDLNTFGLALGKINLTISSADKSETITFGKTNPITLNRYVLKDKTIYTINEIVYGVLGTSVTQLLAHQLFPSNIEVINVDAPELLASLPVNFWTSAKASNIADENEDDIIIGKIKVTLNAKSDATQEDQIVIFNVIAVKPVLILSRSDLKVKYTFPETI